MENNFDGTPERQVRASADRLASDAKGGINRTRAAASSEIQNLISDVEELVARVADLKDSDVIRVRNKVEHALAAAKEDLANRTATLRRQARQVASTADDYVRESPWQALGIAALVGVAFGYLAARRS